ncbi:hypothetical protein [Rhizobium sp. CRRU65]|uniref:hypothetical protein n=1 Tax=Rhizobium sp. CRRU65 TaxID=3399566 RepID=UPI003AF7DF4D
MKKHIASRANGRSALSLKTSRPGLIESSLLQVLPDGLEQVRWDMPRALRAAGLWKSLPKGQRTNIRSLAPALVTVDLSKPEGETP